MTLFYNVPSKGPTNTTDSMHLLKIEFFTTTDVLLFPTANIPIPPFLKLDYRIVAFPPFTIIPIVPTFPLN